LGPTTYYGPNGEKSNKPFPQATQLTNKPTVSSPAASNETPNPYPPGSANAKKFDTLTARDKEWVARPVSDDKGGMRPGQPNIADDDIILSRAPDGGKPRPVVAPVSTPTPNIASAPADTTKKPEQNTAPVDSAKKDDIKKLNDLVDRLEKIKPAEKPTKVAGSPASTTKPDIQGFQDAVLKVDPGALPRYGADGKMGRETQGAMDAHPDIAAKFNLKENLNIADSLIESFGYQTEGEATLGQQAAVGAGTYAGAKGIGKMLGKAVPGVGLAFGAADAYNRAKKGDWVGAGLAGASGLASLVPGVGTAASLGLDAANLARDYKHGEFDDVLPTGMQQGHAAAAPADTTKMPPGADPKVYDLQTKLLAKGAKNTVGPKVGQPIDHDGKMGANTQAAMKQFGIQAETVAESIASLRDRLAMIEAEQHADEGYGDYVKMGKEFAQSAYQGLKGSKGLANVVDPAAYKASAEKLAAQTKGRGANKVAKYSPAQVHSMATAGAERAPSSAALKGHEIGAAIKNNPGKVGLGAAALGTGAGLALTPGGSKETPDTAPVASTGSNNGNIAASPSDIDDNQPDVDTTPTGPTDEQKELINQIRDLLQTHGEDKDPAWISAVTHSDEVIGKIGGGNFVDTRGTISGKDEMEESTDAELVRWLKIARG
jgi:hypothetical protein